jgi:hypothetical protein
MERPPFPAYDGEEPYIFVCYSHRNARLVYPELVWLRGEGFNIWYDEGISPGTVWRDELARAIEGARMFLFFVSSESVVSSNCARELNFALDQEMPMVAVYLEPSELPPGLRLAILDRQAIHRYQLRRADYERKLRRALSRMQQAAADVPSRQSQQSRRSRLFVVVAEKRPANDPLCQELVTSMTRYLSWYGGAFRAVSVGQRGGCQARGGLPC